VPDHGEALEAEQSHHLDLLVTDRAHAVRRVVRRSGR
jgi:hypothetical protein